MKAPQVKSIAALARGLHVLQLLQTRGAMALGPLHEASGIPRASLLRILKTLIEAGMVWQRMADRAYVPSYALSEAARRMTREDEMVEAASPVLARLSGVVQWPSVLAVPREGCMEVIETNVSQAVLDDVPLGPVGFRINMLRSASGRAWLAACDDATREVALAGLRASESPGDRLARQPGYVQKMLVETRARGFGLRDPDFGGDFDEGRGRVDDGRDSLGVAIRLGSHVPGTINITWSRRIFTRDQAIAAFAGPAMAAAEEIAGKLSEG